MLILLIIIGFPVGLIVGTVQFFRENTPKRERPPDEPLPVERDETTIEYHKQRKRDLMELYQLAEMEYKNADTIPKKRTAKARLMALDERIYKTQLQIERLTE